MKGLPKDLGTHDGYTGKFTRQELPWAYRNGTRVIKVCGDKDDMNPIGATGTVLGSIGIAPIYGYFIEWDKHPKVAVFIMASKISDKLKEAA